MIATFVVIGICALMGAVAILTPSVWNGVWDVTAAALGWLPPLAVIVLLSAGTGILFLLAFPRVSMQSAIPVVKDRIKANMLAIKLFQDDLRVVLKSLGGALGWNGVYIGLNLLPMVVLALPFMLIWFQLNSLYAFDPHAVGDVAVLEASFADTADARRAVLEIPDGVEALPGSVHIPPTASGDPARVLWRLRGSEPGIHEVGVVTGGQTITKRFAVGTRARRLVTVRTASPWSEFFAVRHPAPYAGEGVLNGSSPIRSLYLAHPHADLGMGSGEIGIMLWFVVVSLVVGFALKGVFGVEI